MQRSYSFISVRYFSAEKDVTFLLEKEAFIEVPEE